MLLVDDSGFLRNIKKPTTTGIIIKIIDRHRNTYPIVGGILPESLPSEYVPPPNAVAAPKIQRNRPGHPHNSTAATVAIIPFVLLSIIDFSFKD